MLRKLPTHRLFRLSLVTLHFGLQLVDEVLQPGQILPIFLSLHKQQRELLSCYHCLN